MMKVPPRSALRRRQIPWRQNGCLGQPLSRLTLWTEFYRIQDAAGIGDHYGFHDLRRAFATVNAPKLTPDALQALMRHKSYQTTQGYINMSRQLTDAVETLEVPEILRFGN